jgi:peroxin-19
MESLMQELGGSSLSESAEDKNRPEGELSNDEVERSFKAAWEAMLVEGMDGMGQGINEDAKEKSSTSDTKRGDGESSNAFKDQIRQAMDKLRESESNLKVLSSGILD